ncbi:hypothetical protein, partial [Poseidonocella sp. HB161398]|uniref:hypothetical protein n=1 Tax=Poseidonocella sp. HB161398 TaxID=2320855 RepID=UPI001486CE26
GYEEITAGAADLRGKLRAISLYFFDLSLAHEVQFRQFVGMALLASATAPGTPRRGGRRLEMYRRALSEGESGLDAAGQARLVNALAATTGAEAMIALLDVAGAGAQEARRTVGEVTDAILDRHFGVPSRTAAEGPGLCFGGDAS